MKVGPEKGNSQITAVMALYNSLNISLHFGQCYCQIELIVYNKHFYCFFIKIET